MTPFRRTLWEQRAHLCRLVHNDTEARRLSAQAEITPAQSPRDRYLLLLMQYEKRGRVRADLPLLRDSTRQQRDNFSAWLILGNSYAELGERGEAIECFDMAAALRPSSHWPALCRGLAYLEERNYGGARAAFDEVIRLKPEMRGAYYDRALASYHQGDLSAAHADLSHLLDEPNPPIRTYFLRARVRAQQGDREGAARDRRAAMRGQPHDERDWAAHGLERQNREPEGALADYDRALEMNPRYRTALRNKANILGEQLGRTADAIAALDTLLGYHPGYVPALAGRGVLHARLGHREAAHADAVQALENDETPYNIYQVAGIYALTSRQCPTTIGKPCACWNEP